ncbi:MAG: DoxX family protein [Actinomycetota bacterium]
MIVFTIILSVLYGLPGVAKLAGAKPLAEQFDEFGLGRQVMRVVGALEVAAAIGLYIDALDTFAALGMIAMMIGALISHRRVGHAAQDSMPAAVVLLASIAFVIASI